MGCPTRRGTVGGNRRLDTLQAAVLRVKLRRLDAWNEARRRHAAAYARLLAGTGLTLPTTRADVEPVHHLYVVQAPDRDRLLGLLQERGVGAGLHYPVPIHLQEAYRDRGLGPGAFPVTEAAAARVLSLPMFPELTGAQIERVAEVLQGATSGAGRGGAARRG